MIHIRSILDPSDFDTLESLEAPDPIESEISIEFCLFIWIFLTALEGIDSLFLLDRIECTVGGSHISESRIRVPWT